MAERGGRRVPRNPASYSGVGARAKRTDQPLRSPNVQDSTELPQGSREQILQAQRVAPLSRTPTPRVQPAPARGNSPLAGGTAGAPLPPHLVEMETTRPMEDELTPASPAPPEPASEMEEVLFGLAEITGDRNALDLLAEHEEFQAFRTARVAGAGVAPAPSAYETEGVTPTSPLPEPTEIEPEAQPLGEEVVEEPPVAEVPVEEPEEVELA